MSLTSSEIVGKVDPTAAAGETEAALATVVVTVVAVVVVTVVGTVVVTVEVEVEGVAGLEVVSVAVVPDEVAPVELAAVVDVSVVDGGFLEGVATAVALAKPAAAMINAAATPMPTCRRKPFTSRSSPQEQT